MIAGRGADSRIIGRIAAVMLMAVSALAGNTMVSPARAQEPPPQQRTLPDPYKLNMLIRTTLIALNHANATGNYTVLRDLSAPAFGRTNNAARLAEIFAKLRKRGLDLSPILFFQPKLRRPPAVNDNGLLRLTGFFETKPERISFDMLFQNVGGSWRLFGLAVDVAPPKAPPAETGEAQQPGQLVRTKTEPRTTQDSASAEPAEPAFAPHKVAIPAPGRRPDPPSAGHNQQAGKDDTASDAGNSESSIWPF